MNPCIYFGEKEGLHFITQEHIIPAGIGGIKKLEIGIVSDEFNNIFSKIEQRFIRNSFVSIPRQFIGPGKRGSASAKKESKSEIHIMFDNKEKTFPSLGYIQKGKPYIINQIRLLPTNEMSLTIFPTENVGEVLAGFKQDLQNYSGKYSSLVDNKLQIGEILFGIHKDTWYLGKNKDTIADDLSKKAKLIFNSIKIDENLNYIHKSSQITSHQSFTIDIIDTLRVYCKIAFNCLTFFTDKNFVLSKNFDGIRNWIINGGENTFAKLLKEKVTPIPLIDPDAHYIILHKVESCMMAIVSLYGNNFQVGMKLTEDFNEPFDIQIFACDWKNKREYSTLEYLTAITNEYAY